MTTDLLDAALRGYKSQLKQVDERIAEIRRKLKPHRERTLVITEDAEGKKPKHFISAEGRARIAAAQRKRWANSKPSHRLTPEGRKAIQAASKKRWAAYRAASA